MKTFMIKSTIVVFISTFAFFANAGFHLEPNVGYTLSGDWEQGNDDDSLSMLDIGVRLGYQAPMGLQVGGDIKIGSGTIDFPSGGDDDFAKASFGAYLGYQSAMGIRASFSYYLASAVVIDNNVDSSYAGDGFRLGVGYSFKRQNLSWLAVNLDYTVMTYDEYDDDFTTRTINLSSQNELETKTIILSVSFPFNFGR